MQSSIRLQTVTIIFIIEIVVGVGHLILPTKGTYKPMTTPTNIKDKKFKQTQTEIL